MLGGNEPVVIVAGENGELVNPNPKSPEYGAVRFEQQLFTQKEGFLNSAKRVAFLSSTMEGIQLFVEKLKWKVGQSVTGRIRVEERRTPFFEGQQQKINPSTGAVILVDNAPIYRQMFWDESGKIEDIFITGELGNGDIIAAPRVTGLTETSSATGNGG